MRNYVSQKALRSDTIRSRVPNFIALLLVVALVGCVAAYLHANSDPNVSSVARKYGLHPLVRLGSSQTDLPQKTASGHSAFALVSELSAESGLDVTQHLGERVTMSRYLLLEFHEGNPLALVLMTKDGDLIGAYVTVTGWSTLVPGAFSLPEVAGSR